MLTKVQARVGKAEPKLTVKLSTVPHIDGSATMQASVTVHVTEKPDRFGGIHCNSTSFYKQASTELKKLRNNPSFF